MVALSIISTELHGVDNTMMKISIRWKCVAHVAAVTELLVKMEMTKVKKTKEESQ